MTTVTKDELDALPVTIPAEQSFAAIGIGRTLGYQLLRSGEFPIPVLKIGARYKVRTADLRRFLGL